MKKTTTLLVALLMYLAITTVNEQLFVNHLVLPLFPDGYIREHFWIRQFIHHLGQMVLALGVITLILRGRLKDYGLNLMNRAASLRYVLWFALVYGLITVLNFLPNFIAGQPQPFGFSPTAYNIFGWFSFEALMSGTSEEIFFRGLLQTYLSKAWSGSIRIFRLRIPAAALIAALIFTMAHMEVNFSPFAIEYSTVQVITALVLGIFYGIAYERTKSLLAPILTHNYANFVMYFIGYLTVLFFG